MSNRFSGGMCGTGLSWNVNCERLITCTYALTHVGLQPRHLLHLRVRLRTGIRRCWLSTQSTIWRSTSRSANTDITLKGTTSCHDLCTSMQCNLNTVNPTSWFPQDKFKHRILQPWLHYIELWLTSVQLVTVLYSVPYLKDKWMICSAKLSPQFLIDFGKWSVVKNIMGDAIHFFCKPDSKVVQLYCEGVFVHEHQHSVFKPLAR